MAWLLVAQWLVTSPVFVKRVLKRNNLEARFFNMMQQNVFLFEILP